MASGSNPFATRFTRPGAIEFLLPEGQTLADIVERLNQQQGWGQIIGPHGSGKSTLLSALAPRLEAAGRTVVVVVVRGQGTGDSTQGTGDRKQETVAECLRAAKAAGAATQLVIDGYEQLSWWSRWRIKSLCRRRGAGLLVTAHADVGLPTIFRTQPSLDLARQVVRRLMPAGDATLSDADIVAAFSAHPNNLRELLFALYDVYQSRGR